MKWFRWHRGSASNPTLAVIAMGANKDGGAGDGNRCYGAVTVTDVIAVWAVMLEDAANDEHWGVCRRDAKYIAAVLRWWPDEVQSVIDGMIEFDLIELCEHGLQVVNWDKYQYVSDSDPTNADRQRRHREKKKETNASPKRASNKSNALPKRPETDSETDTDKKEAPKRPSKKTITNLADLDPKDFEPPAGVYAKSELEKAIDWSKANGKRHKDAAAFFRNWLRNAGKFANGGSDPPKAEKNLPRQVYLAVEKIRADANNAMKRGDFAKYKELSKSASEIEERESVNG